MRPVSPLYIGVAAPLMEMAHVWMARMADYPDMRARLTRLKDFPRRDINAYAIQFLEDDRTVLSFRTSVSVHVERVRTAIEQWLGTAPELLPTPYVETITGLDHQRALIELQDALQGQPVRLVRRIGLTLQQLQYDLAEYRPALVLLNCHGTREGCLWFEDGRARSEVVSGERLFPLLQPRPQVLFLLPHKAHKGDLLALLSGTLSQSMAHNRPTLLVLDNLDDLLGQHVALAVATALLLDCVSFCQLTGQLVLLKNLAQQIVDSLRTSISEEDLALCLGTPGNVLRDLGERDAARTAYTEALDIYAPLYGDDE